MKRFLRWCHALMRDTSGGVLVYVTVIGGPILIGVTALGIDTSLLVVYKARLQNTADAAALASVTALTENTGTIENSVRVTAVAKALTYAEKNMAHSKHGTVVSNSDVTLGHWDKNGSHGTPRTFYPEGSTPGGAAINAVQVIARRDETAGNSVTLFSGAMLGTGEVRASAIATAYKSSSNKCLTNGLTALDTVTGGDNGVFANGTCIHGEEGVELGDENCFEDGGISGTVGAVVGMSDPSAAFGNGGPLLGADNEVGLLIECFDLLRSNELVYSLLEQTIGDFANNNLPFNLTLNDLTDLLYINAAVNLVNNLRLGYPNGFPTGLNFMYSLDDISIDHDLDNTVVFSNSSISVNSGVKLEGVYLIAADDVEMGSNITLGRPDYCEDKSSRIFVLAGRVARFGSNVAARGVQIIAGQLGDFGNNVEARAMSVLSGGLIQFGNDWDYRDCEDADEEHVFLDYTKGNSTRYALVK